MGIRKSSKQLKESVSNDGFILTIESDSEGEVGAHPLDDELNATSKDGKPIDKDDDLIKSDFKFALDGDDTSKEFDGWDFTVEENDSRRKDVDLDGILRRKGGLSGLAKNENEVEQEEANEQSDIEKGIEEEENESEDEDKDEEEEKDEDENDDDELALDGFGMGAEADNESERDEDEIEDTQGSENEKDSDDDEIMQPVESDSDASESDKDTADDMAKFYAKESHKTKDQSHMTFQSLQLSRPVLKGLSQLGYTKPSPIQSSSIPIALLGKDIVAGAVTGSGKTAAYMIPIIERLLYKPAKISCTRVVVLAPTRELAIQVCDVGKKIGRFVNNLNFGLAVGGLNLRQQEQQLKSRPDIVIATPGRLIDHIRNSPSFSIDSLEILVIDEADRMLDEGFQAELTEILTLIPKHKRQTLLFSATMNTKIKDLIQLSLDTPVRIMIDPPKATANKLVQEFVRIRKRDHLKPALLFELLKKVDPSQQNRIVVFVARKEMAHRLRVILGLLGMKVSELHGSLTQEQRLKSVSDFKSLQVPVLICTDLAARGLDIPKIEIVINYDMPKTHEIYLHRVGRTARAGREGRSITFVGESGQDRGIVKEAIKFLESGSKAVSRNVDWSEVENLNKIIESKEDTIQEVLDEEKQEKEILLAEMELKKASNLIDHEKEIQSRPKRTWFEDKKKALPSQSDAMHHLTKRGKPVNSKKRKAIEARKEDSKRSYKKTTKDRLSLKPKSKKKRR
ncbi:uncharacterized protein PRCAT00004224001 [Priceomyces carsonii]|uniref:uncharacterized protein n=1 Tax=Priceomyces carsonii TaxID=28549 RepID=UPI002EDB7D3F|nr:unnamed protein product [Priceomyces carsonii]